MRWTQRILAVVVVLALAALGSGAAFAAAPVAFTASKGTYTVTTAGTDIYGSSDSFVYAYAPASGDGTWSVKLDAFHNPVVWTKVGLMVRASLSAGSPMIFLMNGNKNGDWAVDRTKFGGPVNTISGGMGVAPPVWLKIQKKGTTFYVFDSGNGTAWNLIGTPVTLNVGKSYYVGLAASEHDPKAVGSATFSDLVGFTPTAGQGIGVSGVQPVVASGATPAPARSFAPASNVSASAPAQLPKTGGSMVLEVSWGTALLAGGLVLIMRRKRPPARSHESR